MIKGKRSRRALYGLVGAIMTFTAVGGAAAKEAKPYKAPELRLVRGTQDYDLTEGITYNKNKYELMVEDTGDFDIDTPGKYIVEYSLTPLEAGDTQGGSSSSSPGGSSGGGGGSGSSSSGGSGNGSSVKETDAEETKDSKEESSSSKDNGSDTEDKNNADSGKNDSSAGDTGSADADKDHSSSEDSGKEDSGKSDPGKDSADTDSGNSGSGDSSDKDSDDTGSSDQDSGDKDSGDSGNTDSGSGDQGSDSEDSGNSSSDNGSSDQDADSGSDETEKTAKAEGSFFSRLASRWVGNVYAAELPINKEETQPAKAQDSKPVEIKIDTEETTEEKTDDTRETDAASPEDSTKADEESSAAGSEKENETESAAETKAAQETEGTNNGTLDETDDIIYFDRVVRVVPAEGDVNIEYDEPVLEIPSNADLFGIQIHRNVPVATSSNAEQKATASNANPKSESEILWDNDEDFWQNSEEEDSEDFDDDADGITEDGVEYDLILKNQDILLADAFLTDKDGKKIKKAKITVKDDSDLKTAAHVKVTDNGVPYIENLYLGTYLVELAATDPESGDEITCEREIEVVPSERIQFEAPTLYIGTKNLSYDLTAGMMAWDELNQEVKALYVVDETELLNAKEEVVATASNAEAASEDGEEIQTEPHLKKGMYHVVIGAKHPITGEEFTVDRKVEVVDGYYIYAPVLEVSAGSTNYDLTSGAEVRNASDSSEKAVEGVRISVEDISALYSDEETEDNSEIDDSETDDPETEDAETDFEADDVADSAETANYSFSAYSLDETAAAETTAAASSEEESKELPALKAGTYTVTLSAIDPETGEKITVSRQVRVAARTVNLFKFVSHGSDEYATGSVDTLGGLVAIANSSWSNFQNGTTGGLSMKDGADPDVKVSDATTDTNLADVTFSNFITGFSDLSEDASISVDGNNKAFAWDKGTKNPNRKWSSSLFFTYEIPSMQVRLQNFRMENAIWNYSVNSENSSTRFLLNKGSYLELKNIVSGAAENGTLGRASYNSDYDTKTKLKGNWKDLAGGNSEYGLQSISSLRLRPKATSDRYEFDIKLIADNITEMSPLYDIEYPKNLTIDVNCEGGLGPVAAKYISKDLNINTHENGKAELYFLQGAETVTLSGKGTIAFRNAWMPTAGKNGVDTTQETFKHGIRDIQNLIVNDDMMIQRSVHDYNYPIFTFKTGATSKFNGHKITVAESDTTDGSAKRIQKETVIVKAKEADVVNLFDFKTYGVDTEDKTTAQPFVTYADDRKQVKAVLRKGGNIEVKDAAGTKVGTFYSYADALKELKGKSGTYTISNNVEAVFTTDDATALKNFDSQDVSLKFESGIRTDGGDTTFNAYPKSNYSNSHTDGYRYRTKLECDDLELPTDIDVTLANCLFELKNGKTDITIVGNGGQTRFYFRNMFVDEKNQEVIPTVYGGTRDGSKTKKNADIYADYNPDAMYSEAVGDTSTRWGNAILHVKNLYNFDSIQFGNTETLERYGNILIYGDVISDTKDNTPDNGGYKGVIKLRTGGSADGGIYQQFWLLDGASTFKVGSLDAGGGQIRFVERDEYEENGKTIKRDDIHNKYLLTLTAKKPYAEGTRKTVIAVYKKGHKDQAEVAKGDIAFYTPNVPDDKRRENLVPAKIYTEGANPNDGTYFNDRKWMPFANWVKLANGTIEKNYTIRWTPSETAMATLIVEDESKLLENYYDLKSLVEEIKYKETQNPGGKYTIALLHYMMTAEDSKATKDAIDDITTPEQINWTGKLSPWGTDSAAWTNYPMIDLTNDLHLFGQSNTMNVFQFYHPDVNKTGKIFADGKPLTLGPGKFEDYWKTYGHNGNIAIYGGAHNRKVDSTNITLLANTSDVNQYLAYLNGGGDQENYVIGEKKITVKTVGTAAEPKEGMVTITGAIRDYDKLDIGVADAGTTTLEVGKLDSKFADDTSATDRNDQITMQNATLKFTADNVDHVGKIQSIGDNVTISIYKNENITTPLHIDQDVTLESAGNKLKLTTEPGAERAGDLLLKFPQKGMADITKYVDALGTYEIITNRDTDEILFGTKADAYIMTATDHGTDTDPSSAITDKPVSALAEYVGSGEKDINNTWSVPTKSTLADLYNVVYNNVEYSSKTKPTMGTVDAKAYFNRTGYGFRDENWEPKQNTDGTLDTNAEAAVTVKMLQNFEQWKGSQSTARPTYLDASREKQYVWNASSFKNLASSLSLDKYSSLTIDGQGKNLDIDGFKTILPHMQLEFKNFKYIPRSANIGVTTFTNTENTNYDSGTFPNTGDSSDNRALLRFNNISSDPYDSADHAHTSNRSYSNPIRLWNNIDVDLIGSDETPDTVTLILGPDRYRQMYVKAGSKGLKSTFSIVKSYKKLTIDTNNSYVNIGSLGLDSSGTYFADENAEYRMVVGGNGAIRVQPITRNNRYVNRDDSLYGELRGPRAMAKQLELLSDIVISKYAGKPHSDAVDPRTTPVFQLDNLISNGHIVYITLGLNEYDNNSYTTSVRQNLEPTDGMPFLEGYGENNSHLDPTDFRVLTDAKAKEVEGLEALGDWIDQDGAYGVVLKHGPSAVLSGSPDCDKILFVKKEGGKIRAVDSQGTGLGPKNGSFASYEAAFEAISDSFDTEFTITNQAAVEMLPDDLEALKKIQGKKHITFQSSDVDTVTKDKNGNCEIGSYGDIYHIRLRSRYIELPSNVSATFKHTIMRYNQSDEDIVFIANGGKLEFGEDVTFAEGRKAVVYGGSVPSKSDYDGTDLSTTFKTETASEIIVNSGEFSTIYGGGTKKQGGITGILSLFAADGNPVGASITVNGGSVDTIYGGGQSADGTMKGDTTIQINSGTVGIVYGGGQNAEVSGNTSVTIADTSVDTVYGGGNEGKVDGNTTVTMSDISGSGTKSVYGGSIGAEVTGNSTVNINIRNDVTNLETITADGSNVAGETAASVTGDKLINIKPIGDVGDNGREVTIKNLSGFTSLNIGDDAADKKNLTKDPMNTVLTVTERLDTWADKGKNDERTNSTLTLYHSHLKLDVPGETLTGEKQATGGHIGNLATTGLCNISVHRNRPLVVNGTLDCGKIPNTEKYIQIRLYPLDSITVEGTQKYINKPGEIPMTFTSYEEGTAIKFEDGTGYLPISSQISHYVDGDAAKIQDLVFGKLGSHAALTWVEYTGDVEAVTDADTDGIPSGTVEKVLHLSYSGNDHKAAGGYIIAMPKTGLPKDEQLKYTEIDGAFFGSPDADHVPAGGVYLEFNYPAGTTAKDIDITATIPNADPKNNFYIMHMVCVEKEYTTFLLDLNAPVKKSEERIGYDTATGEYTIDVNFEDEKIKDADKLPYSSIGGENSTHNDDGTLRDIQSGIKQWAWSYEDKTDSAKLYWMDVDAENNNAERTNTGLNNITSYLQAAAQDQTVEYNFRVPKKHNVNGVEEVATSVWLYVKDDRNNTAKMQIQLDENLIDVVVPTKVSVIAIKKPRGGTAELLAPVCYIENKGSNEIEARVSGFKSDALQDDSGNVLLQLVNKPKNEAYLADQLSLFLEPVTNSTLAHKSELKETNVMSIQDSDKATWAYIGRMGKNTQNARFLDFTFDAGYDVERINETGGKFLTNIMSYHFTAVHTDDETLGNELSLDSQEETVEIAE